MKLFGPSVTDGYKLGHKFQYPDGTQYIYSNLTPRSNRLFKGGQGYDGKLVFFGLQGALMEIAEMWNVSFFSQPKEVAVGRYMRRVDAYLGAGVITYEHMAELHDYGRLPIKVKALAEGSRVDMKVPVFTVHNTQPQFYWVVNYLETILSSMTWKGSTNATIAYEYKRILTQYALETGSPLDFVGLQAHDFSARGMSGMEDAARSGAAHLTCFVGTDTVTAIDYVEDYYGADCNAEFIACSVPATEHAVSASNILSIEKYLIGCDGLEDTTSRLEAEYIFMKDLITRKHPTGIVSYVADTYDFWKVVTEIVPLLKDVIMARQPDALGLNKLVIRPDSGDPVKIIAGLTHELYDKALAMLANGDYIEDFFDVVEVDGKFYKFESDYDCWYEGGTYNHKIYLREEVPIHEVKGAIECLWDTFGGTTSDKGFKMLDEHIGLIYGDSITIQRAEAILARLMRKGFASCNVVFGIGSYTYQMNTRDTFGFAVKATACVVDGDFVEIYKDPATGDKLKKSAKGLLRVEKEGDTFVLYDQQNFEQETQGELKTVFEDGVVVNPTNLADIRGRLA